MWEPFSSLSDDQIETVIEAVTVWCRSRGLPLESDQGRRAVVVAAELIASRKNSDFRKEIQNWLAREFGDV